VPIFKPKDGPILRWSRGLHALEAAAITTAGAAIWGDMGMAAAGVTAIAGGFLWEVSNRFTTGRHRFGDGWDYLAFVGGALATAAVKTGLTKMGVL